MRRDDRLEFSETLVGRMYKNTLGYRYFEGKRSQIDTQLTQSASDAIKLEVGVSCNLSPVSLGIDCLKGSIHGQVKIGSNQVGKITQGTFQLFAKPGPAAEPDCVSEMIYFLHVTMQDGNRLTFYGFKSLKLNDICHIWQQTTELQFGIFEGELDQADIFEATPQEFGVCSLSLVDLAKSIASFRSNHDDVRSHLVNSTRYLKHFAIGLAKVYLGSAPAPQVPPKWSFGDDSVMKSAEISYHKFTTKDGLSLVLTRFCRRPSENVVMLMHGLTTSTDMFIMPEHTSLVQYLLDHGYTDIWSLDWRGSQRYPYNMEPHSYTLDNVAEYDIPPAVDVIRRTVGNEKALHVIAHCVGSIGFSCALAAGKVKGITSFIGNSVSLTPAVSNWSKVKIYVGPEILETLLGSPYLSPRSANWPGLSLAKGLGKLVSVVHRESRSTASNLVSFMWGDGNPAAYELDNLSIETYQRLSQLFGGTSFNYYRHIRKMLIEEAAVSFDGHTNYLESALINGLPPTLLLSGANNNIFPGSNRKTFDCLRSNQSIPVEFREIAGYGHQDIFMGKSCRIDVFPKILHFLRQNSIHKGLKNVVGE